MWAHISVEQLSNFIKSKNRYVWNMAKLMGFTTQAVREIFICQKWYFCCFFLRMMWLMSYFEKVSQLINCSRLHFVRFIIVVWSKNGLSKLTAVLTKIWAHIYFINKSSYFKCTLRKRTKLQNAVYYTFSGSWCRGYHLCSFIWCLFWIGSFLGSLWKSCGKK